MRYTRTPAIALLVSTAMALTSVGAALGQEESPAPDASIVAEASPAAEVVEPSTLSILQVATDKAAGTKLKGKKYAKAIKKAAPNAVAYLAAAGGGDAADHVIQNVLMARAADAEENYELADAYLGLATAIYRNAWTAASTGPIEFNTEVDQAVAERYAGQDGLSIFWPQGTVDICMYRDEDWIVDMSVPWQCAGEGALPLRVDESFVDGSKNGTKELYSGPSEGLDVGFALHQVAQNENANIPLKGKKYRKAIAGVAPVIAEYVAGGSGAGRMNGIIDLVLLAREADEAGNAKAAKAFMALALATYRAGLTSSTEGPEAFNTALNELGYEIFDGESGGAFELFPPGGMEDICVTNKKKGAGMFVGPADMWLCATAGGRVLRASQDDVDNSKNGMPGFYKGDG